MTKSHLEAHTPGVAPWIAEPYRLWSLYDMLDFWATSFIEAIRNVASVDTMLLTLNHISGDGAPARVIDSRAVLSASMEDLVAESNRLPFSPVVKDMIAQTVIRFDTDDELTIPVARSMISALMRAIRVDMEQHWFLMVPHERSGMYVQTGPQFDADVEDAFPEAVNDIDEAARCIALDRWTAAVFHLMRAVEHGLHNLAIRLEVVSPDTAIWAQQETIIDQLDKKIRELGKAPRGTPGRADLQRLASASSQFWFFKEAWRNHVSHGRDTYAEHQTMMIWNSVRNFMQGLAADARS